MPLVAHNKQPLNAVISSTPRILVVDDQLVVRGAIRSAIDQADFKHLVIETDNGHDALAIMKNTRVDIIFCDVHLPGISGPEALAHAYAERQPRPFMVLVSTINREAAQEFGRKIGIYEYIPKPFRPSDVISAIQAYERLKRVTRVLLVDDSATARKLMARILGFSQFHIELEEASNGKDAIEMAKQTPFDVIICDFNMPGLDGAETASALLQVNPGAQIVVVSTEQQAKMVKSAQFAGAFAYLKKPFVASDVDAILHDAFAIKRPSLAKQTHAIFSNEDAVKAKEAKIGAAGPRRAFGGSGVA